MMVWFILLVSITSTVYPRMPWDYFLCRTRKTNPPVYSGTVGDLLKQRTQYHTITEANKPRLVCCRKTSKSVK